MKRGEGSEEKKVRSEVDGKENKTLKPYMKRYKNVDDNILTDMNKLCTYQLVHEGEQMREEKPNVCSKLKASIKQSHLLSIFSFLSLFLPSPM